MRSHYSSVPQLSHTLFDLGVTKPIQAWYLWFGIWVSMINFQRVLMPRGDHSSDRVKKTSLSLLIWDKKVRKTQFNLLFESRLYRKNWQKVRDSCSRTEKTENIAKNVPDWLLPVTRIGPSALIKAYFVGVGQEWIRALSTLLSWLPWLTRKTHVLLILKGRPDYK